MPAPVQVAYKPIGKPEIGVNNYQGFFLGKKEILPKGWNGYGALPLESDIEIHHDVEIKVRDGWRLYIDVYKPANTTEKLPAILGWSPYGKKYSGLAMLPITTWHCCVKRSDLSGLEKFEGLDPQLWCPRGYAIVSIDSRGSGNSDGQVPIMGVLSNFLGAMDLLVWQAIAPWEGCEDLFREQFVRGGVFSMVSWVRGNTGVEDFAEMYRRSPLANAYWNDKRPGMKSIKCPAYISGSDFSSIHTMGSIRGFMEIDNPNKWIRWSGWQEWYDLWCCPETNQELGRFFDRYLKGEENGWEETPHVRWTALKFGDREPISNISLEDFPAPNTDYKTFHLNSNNQLSEVPATVQSVASYNSEDGNDFAGFTYTFPKASRLIGIPKAYLHMSCDALDDMSIFIILRKLDKAGNVLTHLCFPFNATPVKSSTEIPEKDQSSLNLHMGSVGILRASHRAIDHSKSIHPQFPFHPHENEEKIEPGTIVELEIGIWAMGVDFDEGESLRMQIGGQFPSLAEYKAFSDERPDSEKNKGIHKVHFGGEYPSRVILPFLS